MPQTTVPRRKARKIVCVDVSWAKDADGRVPRSKIPGLGKIRRAKPLAVTAVTAVRGRVACGSSKTLRRCTASRTAGKPTAQQGVTVDITFDLDALPEHTTSTRARHGKRTLRLTDFRARGWPKNNSAPCDLRKPLSAEERTVLDRATSDASLVLVDTGFGGAPTELRARDFKRALGLGALSWLDDGLVNAYCELICRRNASFFASAYSGRRMRAAGDVAGDELAMVHGGRRRTYVFNSFLYGKLIEARYDYATSVRRWTTGRVRVLEFDKLLFPINLGNTHWVLAGIDIRYQRLVYLDSLHGGDTDGVLERLREWLTHEVTDKYGMEKAKSMNICAWRSVHNPPYTPRQRDGESCGVFMVMLADYLELGKRPDFTQADIRTLRERAAISLYRGVLSVT